MAAVIKVYSPVFLFFSVKISEQLSDVFVLDSIISEGFDLKASVDVFFCLPSLSSSVFICPFFLLLSLQAISNKDQHSISYTLSRVQMVVVEYTHDSNTDMFQVISLSF